MKIKIILRGILKMYFPWLYNFFKKKGTGGTNSALYCYSVWLRHLVLLYEKGMCNMPKSVVEIGPGDSLGVGLNALLTGANEFYAFDIIKHANIEMNLKIFDELVELYKRKVAIPNGTEFQKVKPKLKDYKFPTHILSEEYLEKMLETKRLAHIRRAIKNSESGEFIVRYILPGDKNRSINKNSIDLVYSQAVMEHIIDIDSIYKNCYLWLKKGGFMSHQIDYSSHGTHNLWFGHWTYPKWLWNIILEGRLYPVNRYPNSYHIRTMLKNNFKIAFQLPFKNTEANSISKDILNKYEFTKDDLQISGGFIIAKKD